MKSQLKKTPSIKINFKGIDGEPDFEMVEDLWCAARALRKTLMRYDDLVHLIQNIEINGKAVWP